MATGQLLMSDKDVAEMFGVSVVTVRKRLSRPVVGELDLRRAEPQKVGGKRFWLRHKVEAIAGIRRQASRENGGAM